MSELQQAINEMRNMRKSYDQLGAAAEAYNVGKMELAAAITGKGVETSPTESYPEMAKKVNAISQETYEINGGEMYAKQLFGSLETPNFWNLYEVLANLLSDGRLVSYGGILLAEYYRGYDSLALAGAGAGGAYVVSDKDENGQFKMYTNDTTHTWATEFDGKGNRWVAYCFADEYHDFQITDTNTSPRSIFIGRKVGTIDCLVNTRISQIVVPDGNELSLFNGGNFAHDFGATLIIRNVNNVTNSLVARNVSNLYVKTNGAIGSHLLIDGYYTNNAIIIAKQINQAGSEEGSIMAENFAYIQAETITGKGGRRGGVLYTHKVIPMRELSIIAEELSNCDLIRTVNGDQSYIPNLKHIKLGYISNDKARMINVTGGNSVVEDIDLQTGWNKPINIGGYTGLTEENMYAHILQRLKQDEPDCGVGVTITLGSTNLAKLTSEESQALLAELRGTYGYTFA